MNWFPRSLRGRTLLLTIAAIVACEGLTLAVFGNYRHTFLGSKGRDYMSSHILLTRTALRHASPEEVAQDLEHSGGRRLRLIQNLPDNATNIPPSPGTYSQALVTALRDDYGTDSVRFTPPPESALWVQVNKGGWWLKIPYSRFDVPIPWEIVASTLAAVALMAIMVALYVMHLSRPLRALAEAAGRFDIGQRPHLVLSGPDEVRAVTAQFNAMAERLAQNDAERRVMLAGLPHDLRAPLARAKLRLALMEDGERGGFDRDLNEIERIANQFIAYLRGLDRDTSGFTTLEIDQLLQERVRNWQGTGQDVSIETIDAATVSGDSSALERAIDNLIGNAFAHGEAPVRVRGIHSGTTYRIDVEDCGPGIPETMRSEATRPFVRLDSARGDTHPAAAPATSGPMAGPISGGGHCGLGLAVVQAVSRLHGANFVLDNAAKGGLIASIILPNAGRPRTKESKPRPTPSFNPTVREEPVDV